MEVPSRQAGSDLCELVDPKRRDGNMKADSFRCQASEGLSLYPLLAYFVSTQSILTEIASHHLAVLQDAESLIIKPGLVDPHLPSRAHLAILNKVSGPNMVEKIAQTARFNEFETCATGDVVQVACRQNVFGFVAAQVLTHVNMNWSQHTK